MKLEWRGLLKSDAEILEVFLGKGIVGCSEKCLGDCEHAGHDFVLAADVRHYCHWSQFTRKGASYGEKLVLVVAEPDRSSEFGICSKAASTLEKTFWKVSESCAQRFEKVSDDWFPEPSPGSRQVLARHYVSLEALARCLGRNAAAPRLQ